jgi:mono/diheme cytochrome c family protein
MRQRDRGAQGYRWMARGLVLCLALVGSACQQEMARQPSYRPLDPTDFFADGRASRGLVEGTVPRGRPLEGSAILTYSKSPGHANVGRAVALVGNPTMTALAALLPFTLGPGVADYVDVCPIAIDKKAIERGRERFNIFCAICHDQLGTGNGKIVERGYLRPPNFHTDYSRGFERRGIKVLLRDVPIGYYFEVVSRGYGGMPDYASQIAPDDRWKIIAYVRALQLSQWAPLKDLSRDEQDKAQQALRKEEERP